LFKKLLLTLSALTLLMAGASFAGDTEWSFYGEGHVSLNSLSNGEDSQLGVTSNTSKFGFRGKTPMNEDFTAFWQFESALDVPGNNSEGTRIGTRNTYVGMKHATAGKLMVGRHESPIYVLGRKVELFANQLGDFRAMTDGWDNRLTEIIAYVSPDWDGFSIFAAYQFDQVEIFEFDKADWEAKTALGAMAMYSTEQFMIGAGYEAASSGYGDVNEGEYGDGPKAIRLAGKFMAEQFDIVGLFQSASYQEFVGDDLEDWKTQTMGVGAAFKPSDKWKVKGQMYMLNTWTDADDDSETDDIDEGDATATMLAFGIDRIFTPNVMVYAQFVTMSNGDVTNVPLAGGQSGFGQEVYGMWSDGEIQNPSGISLGTVISW
jgi:predicted porin